MRKILLAITIVLLSVACGQKDLSSQRWTEEQASKWYEQTEWPVGCNYVPSYAINQYEFWQPETFDIQTIDRELGLAESLGFNTVRIYLHEGLWYADKDGFKQRINTFFETATKHGIKMIVTFFTNGGNHDFEFKLGPQPEPIVGTHATNWIPSPGKKVIDNPEEWPRLKEYVQDILKTYGQDERVLYWCLCNEPENFKAGCDVTEFMPEVYKWAWEVRPSQPLSSPIWIRPGQKGETTKLKLVNLCLNLSDIITFHAYYDKELTTYIKMLKPFNRPMICQEYMGRPNSTFEYSLPILKREKIGAINWGLVRGKCGFFYPWGSKAGSELPKVWFHDIFNPDGTPYSETEIEFIRSLTAEK